ncbi:hypothetical protein, partial [Chryseobacterium lactis]|uniref:hypothetical protein n=1 Tax=Chryseobacterium lactis TaxID=1241981 RepID=UPI001C8AB10F
AKSSRSFRSTGFSSRVLRTRRKLSYWKCGISIEDFANLRKLEPEIFAEKEFNRFLTFIEY